MKELVILSGKGGTGKTSITAALLSLAADQELNPVICDADVDAANLHLILIPQVQSAHEFKGGNEAVINPDKCTGCGQCADLCRFDAVTDKFQIDPVACEGCGVCVDLCPVEAIDFPETVCGEWFHSDTRFGPFVHARLGIAQENSGKLVALVREEARKLARQTGRDLIITDGPPGIGCPVIASVGQATAVLVVAEPTVSGLHDLKRVQELCGHFKIPAMICINKADLNPDMADTIEKYADNHQIPFVGRIPFDPLFVSAMVAGQNLFEHQERSSALSPIKSVWDNVWHRMSMSNETLNNRIA